VLVLFLLVVVRVPVFVRVVVGAVEFRGPVDDGIVGVSGLICFEASVGLGWWWRGGGGEGLGRRARSRVRSREDRRVEGEAGEGWKGEERNIGGGKSVKVMEGREKSEVIVDRREGGRNETRRAERKRVERRRRDETEKRRIGLTLPNPNSDFTSSPSQTEPTSGVETCRPKRNRRSFASGSVSPSSSLSPNSRKEAHSLSH